ncbi:hypothetical protein EVAR_6266_1 [Eumeta japonica]|uniref:Uncharacterized protein n=1 Tax=Eumeta variegata TaxID=151549 RepID=A0A4C1T884_EUMVA|nr:hypothetical protein EVAR_6266_1 [Eumeta japonica]
MLRGTNSSAMSPYAPYKPKIERSRLRVVRRATYPMAARSPHALGTAQYSMSTNWAKNRLHARAPPRVGPGARRTPWPPPRTGRRGDRPSGGAPSRARSRRRRALLY